MSTVEASSTTRHSKSDKVCSAKLLRARRRSWVRLNTGMTIEGVNAIRLPLHRDWRALGSHSFPTAVPSPLILGSGGADGTGGAPDVHLRLVTTASTVASTDMATSDASIGPRAPSPAASTILDDTLIVVVTAPTKAWVRKPGGSVSATPRVLRMTKIGIIPPSAAQR